MKSLTLFILIYILILPAITFSQGKTSAEFLKLNPGVRQEAMGGAFTGVGDDVYTIFGNPGGIGFIRNCELSGSYTKWFADIYFMSFLFSKQFRLLGSRKTTIGIGSLYLGMPEWDNTEGLEESVYANDLVGVLSFGQRLDWLSRISRKLNFLSDKISIGINIKYIRSNLARYNAHAWAYDAGILFKSCKFKVPIFKLGPFKNGILSAGFAIQNIGTKMKFESMSFPLPVIFRGGIALRFFGNDKHHQLLLASDISKLKGAKRKFHIGAEYWYNDIIGFRLGYKTINKELNREIFGIDWADLTFGISLKISNLFLSRMPVIKWNANRFDYAGSDYGEILGFTYKGAYSLYSSGPEPFRLLQPVNLDTFKHGIDVKFSWEKAIDPDPWDSVSYCLILSNSIEKIENIIKEAKKELTNLKIYIEKNKSLIDTCIYTSNYDTCLTLDNRKKYYWTVIAFDTEGHTRIGHGSKNYRIFEIKKPDLLIEIEGKCKSKYNKGKKQDKIKSIKLYYNIRNEKSGEVIKNFKISISDTFVAQDNSYTKNILDTIITVSPLNIEKSINLLNINWDFNKIGTHKIYAYVDIENQIDEFCEKNNSAFYNYTIPNDTIYVKRKEYEAIEIPFVPFVFFDSLSTVVKKEYYDSTTFYNEYLPGIDLDTIPKDDYYNIRKYGPTLEIFAKRLIRVINKDTTINSTKNTNIKIRGYYDPKSGEYDETLAIKRAMAVKSLLTNLFNINESILKIDKEHNLSKQRINVISSKKKETKWINEENRRVEFITDTSIEKDLFGPIEINVKKNSIDMTLLLENQMKNYGENYCLTIFNLKGDTIITLNVSKNKKVFWDGFDKINKPVSLNTVYYYKLTNKKNPTPKKSFYLKQTGSILKEEIYSLAEFDTTKPPYNFYWEKLPSIANFLYSDTSLKAQFIGHCCEIGGTEYNCNLSIKRAKILTKEFQTTIQDSSNQDCFDKDYNIKNDRYILPPEGEGEHSSFKINLPIANKSVLFYLGNNNKPLGRNLNRRVMITIVRGGQKNEKNKNCSQFKQ
jgi:outer membrane protein OmpA-like peptidoglycan-associated protein